MSHTVTIYGASDDLIEVEGKAPGCDEYNADAGSFIVSSADASTRVRVWYGTGGCWHVSAAPIDEDVPMLPTEIVGERYTAKATFQNVSHVTREAY